MKQTNQHRQQRIDSYRQGILMAVSPGGLRSLVDEYLDEIEKLAREQGRVLEAREWQDERYPIGEPR